MKKSIILGLAVLVGVAGFVGRADASVFLGTFYANDSYGYNYNNTYARPYSYSSNYSYNSYPSSYAYANNYYNGYNNNNYAYNNTNGYNNSSYYLNVPNYQNTYVRSYRDQKMRHWYDGWGGNW